MPVIINSLDASLELLKSRSTINDVFQEFEQLIHNALREVHSDVTIVLFELLLKCIHVSDVRLGGLRLSDLIKLVQFPLLLLVFEDLLLHLAELIVDEALALIVVQSSHAAQIEKGKLSECLGISNQFPLFEKHPWLIS